MIKHLLAIAACCCILGCSNDADETVQGEPFERGPYAVGSTNMQIAAAYAGIGDDAMHAYLLGRGNDTEQPGFVADILEHPESAWLIDVTIPDSPEIYGPASGMRLPVSVFLTFPSAPSQQQNPYAFPYHGAMYGVFEDMLEPGEAPSFADPDVRYPLIVLSHGASAHGIYDVRHAHQLASHGFVVAVLSYGDDRTAIPDELNRHLSYLRPLLTKAVLDEVLASETFGPHIDADAIGITGHSFGGFTALALAGGQFEGNPASVSDPRIKAAVLAAPWVGGRYDGVEVLAFGPENETLNRVGIPVISLFGSRDTVTTASYILPAMRQLSGPTYVVELVDQPHVFEQGSWEDRDNWELLFFSAYLKQDQAALALLQSASSMRAGNEDRQLFDYQKTGLGMN